MIHKLPATIINNISRSIPKEAAATKIEKCWRGYQARKKTKELTQEIRTEFLDLKKTLATIIIRSQRDKRRITFNDIHYRDNRIAGFNEVEELVAEQHKVLHPEDVVSITNKLKTCVAADKPVEEAFKNVIFKNIRSYEEFLKTLPADKRTDPATQRIGKLPFEEELPNFKDEIAEFMADDDNINYSSLKTGSEDIKFHPIGSGTFGCVYFFKVGDRKYVLKAFGNGNKDWINNKRGGRGTDQYHGYLAETNRLFYLQAKRPKFAKHFAKLHYADLGGENKFAISEYVEKADIDYDNLYPIRDKLETIGFECTDTCSDNVHGSTIIDAGGIYVNNFSKYPSANGFVDKPIFIDKSESEDRIIVGRHNHNYSRNIPLVVSMPREALPRDSKLPVAEHYKQYAYTKPAHISVFVPPTPPASE